MAKNILTAKQIAVEAKSFSSLQEVEKLILDHTKFYVKAALEAAAEQARLKYPLRDDNYVKKESILNAYPENLIK